MNHSTRQRARRLTRYAQNLRLRDELTARIRIARRSAMPLVSNETFVRKLEAEFSASLRGYL